jgi:hypothetical protein
MELEQLIAAFDSAVGLEQQSAADGIWKFSADGHVFGVTADEKGENAFLFGEIPAPSPDREDQFRKTILEANFFMRGTGGAVFSLNPDTGDYTLVQSERLDRLDPKAFFALVEKFVNTLATWKGVSAAAQGETPSPPPNDGAETPPLESFGFMQV